MIGKGLLVGVPIENNHRVENLKLTVKAIAICAGLMPIMQTRQVLLLEASSDEELETFFDVLEKTEVTAEQRDIV